MFKLRWPDYRVKSGCWKAKSRFAALLSSSVYCCWGRISWRVVWNLSLLKAYMAESIWMDFHPAEQTVPAEGLCFLWYLILSFGKVSNETLLQIWLSSRSLFKWQKINTITKSIKWFFTLQLCFLYDIRERTEGYFGYYRENASWSLFSCSSFSFWL